MNRFIYILLYLFPFILWGQETSITATSDTNQILIGEEVTITYKLTYPRSIDPQSVQFPNLNDSLGNNWELRKINPITNSSFNNENGELYLQVSQEMIIANFDSGKFELPPKIASVGKDSIISNSLLITINPVKINNENEIKDIKDIKKDPFTFWESVLLKLKAIFKWIKENWLILLCILFVGTGLYYYFFKIRKKKGFSEKENQIPVPIKLLSQLDEIESMKLWQNGNYKSYFSKIDAVLWEFIAYKYKTATFEKTSSEILNELKLSAIQKEDLIQLEKLFNISDMVKFAKQIPNQEENLFAMEFSRNMIELELANIKEHEIQ